MTKSKFERLIKELVEKYNDPVVAFFYDHYATMIYTDPNDARALKFPEDAIVKEIHLSDVIGISGFINNGILSDIKCLEDIASGKRRVEKYPIEVKESKEIYESEEQRKIRKVRSQEFRAFMGNMMGQYHTYEMLHHNFDGILTPHTGAKEFGMAMDNHRKRK